MECLLACPPVELCQYLLDGSPGNVIIQGERLAEIKLLATFQLSHGPPLGLVSPALVEHLGLHLQMVRRPAQVTTPHGHRHLFAVQSGVSLSLDVGWLHIGDHDPRVLPEQHRIYWD